ncbi:hypothetical protein [Streptomyces sp. NPDC007883]|uniref:hypothetical protein n=1 Tax=Streptomyces sp. NPDC007883 TaxID=3155116 RepID=UPI0033DE23AD
MVSGSLTSDYVLLIRLGGYLGVHTGLGLHVLWCCDRNGSPARDARHGIGGGSILGPVRVGRGVPVTDVAPAAFASTFATCVVGATDARRWRSVPTTLPSR